ncbi:MAG: YbjN domain-containing protein [Candidatus Nanopelagicales bacterium]
MCPEPDSGHIQAGAAPTGDTHTGGVPSQSGRLPEDGPAAAVDVAARLAALLVADGVEHERTSPVDFVIVLPGSARKRTTVSIRVGPEALTINAFVCRRPEENVEAVYRWMLQRNTTMLGVAFALDRLGDVYLVGHVPVAGLQDADLDRLLGSVLQNSDESFNALLSMGFASAIRRERAWRKSRGESLDNLAAFPE